MTARWALKNLQDALSAKAVVAVCGLPASGKTELVAGAVAAGSKIVSLEASGPLKRTLADPASLVADSGGRCLVVDSAERAPELLRVIARTVRDDPAPGQFVLISSTDLRGRLRQAGLDARQAGFVPVRTLSTAERLGARPEFLERLFEGDISFACPPGTCGAGFALQQAVRGGFPLPAGLDDGARTGRLLDEIACRIRWNVKNAPAVRRADLAGRLLAWWAAHSGSCANLGTTASTLGAARSTIAAYQAELKAAFVLEEVPACTLADPLGKAKGPRFFLTDTGLMARLLGVRNADRLLAGRRSSARLVAGKLTATWIYCQLAAEAALHPDWTMRHLRTPAQELDLVIGDATGRLLGIRAKTTAGPCPDDFRHMSRFLEAVPAGRATGVILYAGNQVRSFGDRCHAIPYAALWAGRR